MHNSNETALSALQSAKADITTALNTVDTAIEAVSTPPEPEPKPRPALPASFAARVDGARVVLRWDFPLPQETESVQVMRRPDFKDEGQGWRNMTTVAQDGYVDVDLPALPRDHQDAGFEYRIRGYGYKLDGTPHASTWSETINVGDVDRTPPAPGPDPDPDPDPGPDPEPGPVPEFNAIEGVGKTLAENKAVIDPIRASRAPRPADSSPGNITPQRWESLKDADGNVEFKNMFSTPVGGIGWNANLYLNEGTPPERRSGSLTFRNLGWDNKDAPQLYFGSREYNTPERFVIDCDFSNQSTYHSLYLSPYEDVTITGSTWKNIAGQAVQMAQRPVASGNSPINNAFIYKPVKLTVKDSHFIDCATMPNAASWNFTVYGHGTAEYNGTVLMENCSFVNKWDSPRTIYGGLEIYSTGGLIVKPTGTNAVPNPDEHVTDSVVLRNCLFDYTSMDRSFVELRSVKEALIEDCGFVMRDCERGADIVINRHNYDEEATMERIIFRNVHARADNALPGRRTKLRMRLIRSDTYNDHTIIPDVSCPGSEKEYDQDGVLVYEGPLR